MYWPLCLEILRGQQSVAFNLVFIKNVESKMAAFEKEFEAYVIGVMKKRHPH